MRAATLFAATTVLVLSVGSLTACGPTDPKAKGVDATPTASGSASSGPATGQPSETESTPAPAESTPTGGRNPDDPNDRLQGVWMESGSIPMNSAYHWPMLDLAAKVADGEKFLFEEHCESQRTPQVDSLAQDAWIEKARPGKNDGDQNWLAQETVAAHMEDGERNASAMFDGLVKELQACSSAQTSVEFTTQDSRHVAATIVLGKDTGRPTTSHEYLAVVGNRVLELSLWVTPYHEDGGNKPDVAWPNPSDATVFEAMTLPVCPNGQQC